MTPDRHALPADDPQRSALHNEVHARPPARIRLPALVVYVAVLNEGISRQQECEHLRQLPGQQALDLDQLDNNFLRLRLDGYTVKWERHTEFTRYSIVQPLPETALLGASEPELQQALRAPADWLQAIPGRTIAAVEMALMLDDLDQPKPTMELARRWLGPDAAVASLMGFSGHSWVVTDFRLRANGFERMLVLLADDTTETRAGRISQRLLEIETYRLMALRGLPVAKRLGPELSQAESALANITLQLENKAASDQELLDALVALAARIERATSEHMFRFSATRAYDGLVAQRIAELREQTIPGTQTVGEFMQRRLSPAIATVAATSQRLVALSDRVAHTSALLRTRVDIATEEQNRQLLEKLTRGQAMQLRLQSTVEGLSIAAISYYVISLTHYGSVALKEAGLPVNPEIAAGALIPVVLWAVWRTIKRIHATLHAEPH